MLCQFLLYSKMTRSCIYIHSFSPIILHHVPSQEFPVLSSRISLLIHSKCGSLHLLTPNSQAIWLTPSPSWWPQACSSCHKFCFVLFCFFLSIGSFVPYIRFQREVLSRGICLSLSDLPHLVWVSSSIHVAANDIIIIIFFCCVYVHLLNPFIGHGHLGSFLSWLLWQLSSLNTPFP